MGKIVKYCASCDESFAEKFAFCPNCGKGMQAFEMNPLAAKEIVAERVNVGAANGNGSRKVETSAPAAPEVFARVEPVKPVEPTFVAPVEKTVAAVKSETVSNVSNDAKTVETVKPPAPVKETKVFAATAASNGSGRQAQASSDGYRTVESRPHSHASSFNVTVIEEKNVQQRNLLLLGSLLLMMTLAAGGFVYSLFNNNFSIAAIGDESGLAMPVDDVVPMDVEEPPKPENEKKAGGGGGSGKQEQTPTSKGVLANQEEKPMFLPSSKMDRVTNPAIPITVATQGNVKQKPSNEHYGDPNSRNTLSSDGMGSGGGMGSGVGTGQGSGRGSGTGSGIGSGFGSGNGNGNGSGTGDGNEGSKPPPPPPPVKKDPPPVGPSSTVKVLSKPRATYTDEARQNAVTGTVTLRVTFLANGQIGSIAPISRLPHGLTEQAIAAARGIKFEPAKTNGVPKTVTKPVEYSFTIY